MLRLAFSALLLSACLGGTKALAQQQPAPAATPAQAAPQSAQPASKTDTPPSSWIAAAAYVDEAESDPVTRSGGQQVAPGFTAAPTHRVTTDYQGRPLKPFKRVRRSVPGAETPAPAPAPATNTMGTPTATPAPAPATPAPKSGSDW
ncbi:hypothetical protein ACW9KT_02405 [Hymenobacter sp. HD11105]